MLKYIQEKYKDNPVSVTKSFELLKDFRADLARKDGSLGLEPTVYVDQKRRYLDNLNAHRRINIGDDITDSAGYALYLVRMPVSITPGERTHHGYGADLAVTIEHEFTPDFLATTFRSLAINDLTDVLSPYIFESIRSGRVQALIDRKAALDRLNKLKEELKASTLRSLDDKISKDEIAQALLSDSQLLERLFKFKFAEIRIGKNEDLKTINKLANDIGLYVINGGKKQQFSSFDEFREAKNKALNPELFAAFAPYEASPPPPPELQGQDVRRPHASEKPANEDSPRKRLELLLDGMTTFILRDGLTQTGIAKRVIASRLRLLDAEFNAAVGRMIERELKKNPSFNSIELRNIQAFERTGQAVRQAVASFSDSEPVQNQPWPRSSLGGEVRKAVAVIAVDLVNDSLGASTYSSIAKQLVDTVLLDDARLLVDTLAPGKQSDLAKVLGDVSNANIAIEGLSSVLQAGPGADRGTQQYYPVAPNDLPEIFLESTLDHVAFAVDARLKNKVPRASDVRAYLKNMISIAYDTMARPPALKGEGLAPGLMGARDRDRSVVRAQNLVTSPLNEETNGLNSALETVAVGLANTELILRIHEAVSRRGFVPRPGKSPSDFSELVIDEHGVPIDPPGDLFALREELWNSLSRSYLNIRDTPLGHLCWAVAIEVGLLDARFKRDIARTLDAEGMPVPEPHSYILFHPCLPQQMDPDPRRIFEQYIKTRWKIITFALDPTTDEQNILDAFSLRRDLQLALSFAFSTGRLSFSQLNSFRRRLEQDAETIALNRTVTASAHGNDVFGWRFQPRYQNPPNQKTNFGVLASTLISGGPGPDYGTRKSKLETGQRELTAVVVIPSFLTRARFLTTGNWFKLTDPEHLVVPTRRMLEQGRQVGDLRGNLGLICDSHRYRPGDMRQIAAKVEQLEAMLPMQSRVVRLPYDESIAGFDLFVDGAEALVPRLFGYQGAWGITKGKTTSILVSGKNISIQETKVVAGGRPLQADDVDIISRSYLRLRIPGDVDSTDLKVSGPNNQKFVEVFLSTPNGISDRLLIPYDDGEKPSPPAPPTLDPRDSRLVVSYHWRQQGSSARYRLAPAATHQPRMIRIKVPKPTTPPATPDIREAIVTIDDGRGRGVQVTVSAAPSASGEFYTLDSNLLGNGVLQAMNQLYPTIRRGDLPAQLVGSVVLAKPTAALDASPQAVTGTLVVQLVESGTARSLNPTPFAKPTPVPPISNPTVPTPTQPASGASTPAPTNQPVTPIPSINNPGSNPQGQLQYSPSPAPGQAPSTPAVTREAEGHDSFKLPPLPTQLSPLPES